MEKIKSFEGLRFFGCIFIIWNHFGKNIYPFYDLPDLLFKRAGLAVEIFLILSGFLMAKTLFKLKSTFDKEKAFVQYFFSRIKRLWPEYFTVLIIFTIYKLIAVSDFSLRSFGLNFLMLGGIAGIPHIVGGMWYITVLFWGGLLLFSLVLFSEKFGRYVILPFISLFCLFYLINNGQGITGHQSPMVFGLINKGFIRGLLGLSVGIYSYQICELLKNTKINWNWKLLSKILFFFEVLSLTLLLNYILLKKKTNVGDFNIYLCISYLICLLYFKKEILLKFLSFNIFVKLSVFSYSIYLSHLLLITFIKHHCPFLAFTSPWLSYFLVSLLSVGFGYLIYKTTEKGQDLLKKVLIKEKK